MDLSNGFRNLDLFADDAPSVAGGGAEDWPASSRFPLNVNRQHVGDQVLADLRGSREPLIVAGYASLDKLIDFIADCPEDTQVRLLLGFEPFPSRRESFHVRGYSFPKEVETYWLGRNISLLLSAKIIQCIDRLERGPVQARHLSSVSRRLHAKIYVGDRAATVGSSNFTSPGLNNQWEANARFEAATERKRYGELKGIAENYWSMGVDYSANLIALLRELLREVSWQEALARACAELLEGDWAEGFLRDDVLPGETSLWPSQRQGIAQALYVLSRQGSVLVADATGSGKTLMGTHLVRAIGEQIVHSGRLRRGKALMVCPPAVEENWRRDATFAGAQLETFSHGMLSHAGSGRHELVIESLRRAQILCVDEGHNFLNVKSNRTQNLLRNMADHVLLFTATPINRSVVDLLRIVDMLGADNLQPSTLKAFQKMLGVRDINRSLEEEEIDLLRAEIQKFTVRRTKRMLNDLIDRDPEAYRDKNGKPCRFPKHQPQIYTLDEPDEDRELAAEIRAHADQLFAVSHFRRPVEMPDFLARLGRSEESYLQGRLHSAKKIARYLIMATLRSSRLALAEHIAGTEQATRDFDLAGFQKHTETGNMLAGLEALAGKPPKNKLSIALPDWLSDPAAHAEACAHDREIYVRIYQLLTRMTDARERGKALRLLDLATRHSLLLAFDRSPITLAEIRRHIALLAPEQKTLTGTGDSGSERAKLMKAFQWGSAERAIIGLCSDSLAEGVNLQQASCMVHLDMPSVVRIAEQRAGRVDRMDSPHQTVEAWWPQDAPEFALTSDERFVERYETVESLLGSNMPLPTEMLNGKEKRVSTQDIIKEYEEQTRQAEWDGIRDAFEPVRRLVEGDDALVPPATYEALRTVTARVLARVSVVRTTKPWAFFSLSGGSFQAPHWILFTSPTAPPIAELGPICDRLRERLNGGTERLRMDQRAADLLAEFVAQLSQAERALLPRKKQRALEEMERALSKYIDKASARQDQEAVDHYHALLDCLRSPDPHRQPAWDEVAARWLDLIRPIWYERLKQRRNKPLLLADIRAYVLAQEESLGPRIIAQFQSFPVLPSPDERVTACILGVNA
ncbi:helicase [Ectothiorhodospiraceae bacterium 2226]|nr:helicase [Ectothiorhodospiraceae bacterium 2226]